MVRICRTVFWTYVVLCAASLLLVSLGAMGLFEFQADPRSGVFAAVLAQPWFALTSGLTKGANAAGSLIHVTFCVVLNAGIIHFVCRFLRG